jgi:hypothetical protein
MLRLILRHTSGYFPVPVFIFRDGELLAGKAFKQLREAGYCG